MAEEIIQKESKKNPKYKIFVMPKEFRAKPSKGNTNMVIIALSVFLVLFVGVAFFIFSRGVKKQSVVAVAPKTTEEKSTKTEKKPKEETKKEDKKEEPQVQETQLPPIFGDIFSTSRDTDQDGLTDVEEVLFVTSSAKPDTDGDGHLDSSEVINLYNPSGVAPADLKDATFIATYNSPDFNYSLLYPKSWSSRALTKDNAKVIFSADTGEYIQIAVFENDKNQSVLDWYLTQSPDISASQVDSVTLKNGLRGIKTIDGLTYVLVEPLSATIVPTESKSYIYVINYNPGTKIELNFKTTFQMMINSFSIIKP